MLMERRKNFRYQTIDGAVAVLKSHNTIVGPILDICMGGVGFCYLENNVAPDDSYELSIMVINKRFYLGQIAYQTIADVDLPNNLPFSPIRNRRRCVRFEFLTQQQICMLEYFLLHFTIHPDLDFFMPPLTQNAVGAALPLG
jgi:hypothetical protein